MRAEAHQAAGDARSASCRSKAKSIESGIADATISAGAQVAEEHEQDRDDEHRALEAGSRATVSMHLVDEVGPVVDGLDARRPAGSVFLTSSSSSFRPIGHVVAVLAHQHEAEAEHDLALAVGGDRAAADLVADRHVGDVADADRHARRSA